MNLKTPLISIITIVYNDKEGLEKTIQSVLSQTYTNIEYIVIDGGSTDGSVSVIRKYESKISKWVSEPDNGIFDAMNKGIKLATGEWLNMMNAGDFFYSNDVLSNVFTSDIPNSAKYIYSDCEMRFPNGNKVIWKANEATGDVYHQASVYKKELHDEFGYYCAKKPLIMSDVLFFNLIPSVLYHHTSQIIASYDMSGVSLEKISCRVQVTCLKYIFHKISLTELTKRVLKFYLKAVMPKKCWEVLKFFKRTVV